MRNAFAFLLVWMLTARGGTAAESIALAPDAMLRIECSDLPATYYAMQTGESVPTAFSAQLPENYSAEMTFPLFVYLSGGNGGRGDAASAARGIVGPRDFIAVNLPLFHVNPRSGIGGLAVAGLSVDISAVVGGEDASIIAPAYRAMLEKLFAAVPNAARRGNAIAGFSNGGHTIGSLIAAKDEYFLTHFDAFALVEGGVTLALEPAAFTEPRLRGSRFIGLMGDAPKDDPKRAVAGVLLRGMARGAADAHVEFKSIVMTGHGHEQPPEYLQMIGAWVRRDAAPPTR
ncbi:MAG TPA: hypothetical protein VGG30_08445 [Pirellulales bacterium]